MYSALRPVDGEISGGYRIDRLQDALPTWMAQVEGHPSSRPKGDAKRVLIASNLRWWLEFCVATGLLLTARGHHVHLGYLPYRTWFEEVNPFDLRREQLYLRKGLKVLKRRVRLSDLSLVTARELPVGIAQYVDEQSRMDVQYTRQREGIDIEEGGEDYALFQLRLKRNRTAANAALELLAGKHFDVVIIPNGSILEFGIFYKIARHLGIRTVTIEFGEQRQRMWLAQDDEVMRLDTSSLWQANPVRSLTDQEREALLALYQARRGGRTWENFSRKWQTGERKALGELPQQLGLDPHKPLALLCTNVVGDSLALGRQVFTSGMADWLARTVRHFAQRLDAQLVVRVHPGELLGAGHPSVKIVQSALPDLPPHVVVVPPESTINTYDLIDLAHVGLVYTTTVGLELAMSGVPVIVSGLTHYRDKGFTLDPETLSEYITLMDEQLEAPLGRTLPKTQIDLAWKYAHQFFFQYPFPYPWHLINFWEDIEARSLAVVLGESPILYQRALDALVGKPIPWSG